jgi:hypothetical protein
MSNVIKLYFCEIHLRQSKTKREDKNQQKTAIINKRLGQYGNVEFICF